jgi:hypothetical protein
VNAIDGNLTTFAQLILSGTLVATAELTLGGPSPTSAPWSSLTLNVLSSVTFSTGATDVATLKYSLDGGSTFTTIYTVNAASRALTTDSISLPISQNLALVQVQAKLTSNSTGSPGITQNIYEPYVIGII